MARIRGRAALAGVLVVANQKPSDVEECIIVRLASGGVDHVVLGGHINRSDPLLAVMACKKGDDPGACKAWVKEIFAALHQQSGPTDDGFVLFCKRVSPINFGAPNDAGETEQFVGGNYRFEIKGDD